MDIPEGIQVAEAAQDLGLSEQRIRALLAKGRLEGRKVAGRWFVSRAGIERLRQQQDIRGRQFSPSNAWALLLAVSGQDPDWLSPWDRSRLQDRLEADWSGWIPRLRDRARVARFRAHPGSLKKLRSDSRLLLSGVSAAKQQGLDLIGGDVVEGYIGEQDLAALIRDYKLEESPRSNVILHIVSGKWFLQDQNGVPPAVVAIDLIESEDPRSRRAGDALLKKLRRVHSR